MDSTIIMICCALFGVGAMDNSAIEDNPGRRLLWQNIEIRTNCDDAATVEFFPKGLDQEPEDPPLIIEGDWRKSRIASIPMEDATKDSVILFTCQDFGGYGGFVANVEFDGENYFTTDPLESTPFRIVQGVDEPLLFTPYGQGAWSTHSGSTSMYPSGAKWVWNDDTHNTMRFSFAMPIDHAYIKTNCDNLMTVLLFSNGLGGGSETIIQSVAWEWQHKYFLPANEITTNTVIEFRCRDIGYVGGFIAEVEYKGAVYVTDRPSNGGTLAAPFSIALYNGQALAYTSYGSGAWGTVPGPTSIYSPGADWVWYAKQVNNEMIFRFDFSEIESDADDSDYDYDTDYYY
mmetsp:Transcript_47368/g.75946  ORF Transcript_47368/g.75946 Transcript_47368/m.75946 type:complete len:345 (+) Transcript_47368:114-1148(+)